MEESKQGIAINKEQSSYMITFMKKNNDLAKGRLKNLQARRTSNSLWTQLREDLNQKGPPIKETHEWKKTWSDMKYKVKNKLSFNKRSKFKTGGGPYKEKKISEFEEDIINCAGLEAAVEGLKNVQTFGATPLSVNMSTEDNRFNNESNVHQIIEDIATCDVVEENINNVDKSNVEEGSSGPGKKKNQKQDLMEKYLYETEGINNNIKALIDVMKNIEKYSKRRYEIDEKVLKLKKRKLEVYEKKAKESLRLKTEDIQAKLEENRLKRLELEGR